MNANDRRMYGGAMKWMIVLSILSAVMLAIHYFFGLFSESVDTLMAVGVVFWLVMYQGYRADLRQREAEEQAAREAMEKK